MIQKVQFQFLPGLGVGGVSWDSFPGSSAVTLSGCSCCWDPNNNFVFAFWMSAVLRDKGSTGPQRP